MRDFLKLAMSFVAVALLAAGCGKNRGKIDLSEYISDIEFGTDYVSTVPSDGFKLMSFNVRYQNSSDNSSGNGWAKRREGVYEMLKTERPLLMGVQECLAEQRHDIVVNVPVYDAIGVGRDDGNEKGERMAIFYLKDSVTIVNWGTFWLSDSPDRVSRGWDAACNRTCTWARVRIKRLGKEIMYFNTHLDHKGTVARSESVKLIVRKMGELNPDGLPCVLTADFNSTEDDSIFAPLHLMMKSARKTAPVSDSYATYNAFSNSVRGSSSIIDHIFYSVGLNAKEYKTVRDGWKNIDYISDHYPIYAIFTF